MDWQTRRKVSYALAIAFLLIGASIFMFRNILFPAPNCFDKKQNGYESGIDCGGTCSLRCSNEVIPLIVKWSRALNISPNKYDLVALISNKNIDNTSHALGYTFEVYNTNGKMIATFNGTTTVPVGGDFPIIKQNVYLNEYPRDIVVKLNDTPHFTVYEDITSPTLRVYNERLELSNTPRAYATVVNARRMSFLNIPVRVVLYDNDNNAFAIGETVIPSLDKEEIKEISFVWDLPFTQNSANIRVYPIFDAFSLVK
jgi:hypothetical protein